MYMHYYGEYVECIFDRHSSLLFYPNTSFIRYSRIIIKNNNVLLTHHHTDNKLLLLLEDVKMLEVFVCKGPFRTNHMSSDVNQIRKSKSAQQNKTIKDKENGRIMETSCFCP